MTLIRIVEDRFPPRFGKYGGWPLSQVPPGYLMALYRKIHEFDQEIRDLVTAEVHSPSFRFRAQQAKAESNMARRRNGGRR